MSPPCERASSAPWTTSRRSGWRSFRFDVARACRASSTTRRTSATSSSRDASGSGASGQPARKTDRGAAASTRTTSRCQRCSARKGMTGEITRTACTSATRALQCCLLPVPETSPRPADVPVREVVDERLERADDPDGEECVVALGGRPHEAASVRSASGRAARATPGGQRDPQRGRKPRCWRSRPGTRPSSRG